MHGVPRQRMSSRQYTDPKVTRVSHGCEEIGWPPAAGGHPHTTLLAVFRWRAGWHGGSIVVVNRIEDLLHLSWATVPAVAEDLAGGSGTQVPKLSACALLRSKELADIGRLHQLRELRADLATPLEQWTASVGCGRDAYCAFGADRDDLLTIHSQ